MELLPAGPPSLLAAQARTAMRRLTDALGDGRGSPAELARSAAVLGVLTEDLAQLLPALRGRLENELLAGRVIWEGRDDQAVWDAVAAVGCALAHAQTAGLLLARELESARVVLRELAAS
jgi:hypothetical protein